MECTDIPVKIFTDHKGLMYFAEGQDLSRRQARYLDTLSEFNIKIIYRPGPQNIKADALTRMAGSRPSDPQDQRVRHQHRVLLTPDRLDDDFMNHLKTQVSKKTLDLDGVAINAIGDPLYHRVSNVNKDDEDIDPLETLQAAADPNAE